MRNITKDIDLTVDGKAVRFRLTKLDAFSGVKLLRLIMRLEEAAEQREVEQGDGFARSANAELQNRPRCSTPNFSPTIMDLLSTLTDAELHDLMTSVLNHTEVHLPAGLHPVMMGTTWTYPDLEHDTPTAMRLLMEGLSWTLSDFFGAGGSTPEQPAD